MMMDLATIRRMSEERAAIAAQQRREPMIAEDGDSLRNIPNIGSYEPPGWLLVERYFVDKMGFKQDAQMTAHGCLSISNFLERVNTGRGYAIIEEGPFQLWVGEFVKLKRLPDDEPPTCYGHFREYKETGLVRFCRVCRPDGSKVAFPLTPDAKVEENLQPGDPVAYTFATEDDPALLPASVKLVEAVATN